eukprot:CCRYP_013588-RC/>CCRYP_013588-RC protein AED:0.07 eAED:0.07 QI:450/1/1/1/0.6/0.5/6/508/1055
MAQTPQYSYSPPPNEMPLYEALFAAADRQNAGYITGHSAVEFLSLSKLPVDLLKTIWTMADTNPSNNMLDKKKFIVAVRLIQLFQNGKRPMDAELRLGQGETVRPPFFEGVQFPPSGGQVLQQQEVGTPQFPKQQHQQQQQHHQQQQVPHSQPHSMPTPQQSPLRHAQPPIQLQPPPTPSLALTIQDPYTMNPAEQSRYAALFPSYAQDGYVYGPQAVELFSKSGMDRAHLKTIWSMCDVPVDNKLDLMEFCVAMHLIVCVTKKGLGMPEELPGSLRGFVGEGRGQPQGGAVGQQNQQPQPQGGMMQLGMGQGQMGGQPQQQPQLQQSQVTGPGSPGGIPSPDKIGVFSMGSQQGGGIPPPPLEHGGMYGMQQQQYSMPPPPQQQHQQHMHAMGQGNMPHQHHQMGGHVEPSSIPGGPTAAGGETVDDAFAGLSNSPVDDVDEYSVIVGGSTAGGGMNQVGGANGPSAGMSAMGAGMNSIQQSSAPPVHTQQMHHSPVPPQRNHQRIPNPSVAIHAQHSTPASPKVPPPKTQYKPASPPALQSRSHQHEQRSFKPTRKDQEEDEDFNSELEKLRSAHQKLQAEVISLRARANLFSDEEQETQSEIRHLAAGIAELSMELSGLKDQVAESKAKLADALVMLKSQNEKKASLEGAIKDTREINNALVSATEAVIEANEAMMKEHAYAVAATAKAAEASALTAEPTQTDDFFSWDAAPAPVPITVTQTHSRGMSDISHSYGHNWGTDDSSAQVNSPPTENRTEDVSKKVEDIQSVYSTHTAHTTNTGIQSMMPPANTGMQMAPFGGYQGDQPVGGGSSSFFPVVPGPGAAASQTPMPSIAPAPVMTTGGSNYGMDLMGMGSMTPMGGAIPSGNLNAFSTPAPAPPAKVASPSVAEVESIRKEALNVEKSFRESMNLVETLSEEVEKLEAAAKKAEEELQAVEKKKGSFVAGKSKKKKEVAAAQEHATAEREKVIVARQQLVAAQKEAESTRKLADELRQKSEQAELEAATAASLEPAEANTTSNGYYGAAMGNNSNSLGMGVLGENPSQGGYNNPFAM